jgi:acyl-CoA hydrolase
VRGRRSRTECVAVYAGGGRFYQSLQIGSIVECQPRLLHTGRTSMHISVHVRSGDLKTDELDVTTHCLIVFVALDDSRHPDRSQAGTRGVMKTLHWTSTLGSSSKFRAPPGHGARSHDTT